MDEQIQKQNNELYKFFGLYNQSTRAPIPLKQIRVDTKIDDYIAETTYSQIYQNEHDTVLETEYFFPISSTACFHNFRVKFGTVIIEGIVKEKEQAKKQYEEHLEKGDLVAYAEITEESYSVMCVKIGNIPPQSEIEITFAYIERVEISLNKFWQYTLPSSIIPQNNTPSAIENKSLANYPMYAKSTTSDFDTIRWDVGIIINSRSPITFLKSSTHEITVQNSHIGGVFSAKIALENSNKYAPTKDFVILYATATINKPSYLLTPYEKGYCTLINFFPEIGYLTFDDAYLASLQGRDINENFINKSENEFIFVIDRSLETNTSQVSLAKASLINFLKEIPNDCFLNLIKLDKPTEPFFRESALASKENKDMILNNIDQIFEETGESKTQEAFEYISDLPSLKDHPRVVFVLTRGVLKEPLMNITQIIKNKFFKTRLFMLGLGESSRTDYLIKAAIEGYGSHEVIRSQEEVVEKIKHLLKSSTAPYFTDFELKIENESLFSYVIPLPKSIGCITPNELVEFFVMFNKKFEQAKETSFTLKFYNGFNHRFEEFTEKINLEFAEPSESVIKLGISKFCESLMKKKEIYRALNSDIGEAYERDLSKTLVETSVKHKILTSETAFICVVKEGDDIIRQIPTQKITVSKESVAIDTKPKQPEGELQKEEVPKGIRKPLTDEEFQRVQPSELERAPRKREIKDDEPKPILHDLSQQIPKAHYENIGSKPLYSTENLEIGEEEFKEKEKAVGATGLLLPLLSSAELTEKLKEAEERDRQVTEDEDLDASPKPVVDKGEGKITKGKTKGKEVSSSPKLSEDLTEYFATSKPKSKVESQQPYVKRSSIQLSPPKTGQSPKMKSQSSLGQQSPPFRQSSFGDMRNKMKTAASIPQSSGFSRASSTATIDSLEKLFEYQTAEGFWEPVVFISELFEQTIPNLLKQMPAEINSLDDSVEIWLTILILVWIEIKRSQEDIAKWKKSIDKSIKWVHDKGLDYKTFNSSVSQILNI